MRRRTPLSSTAEILSRLPLTIEKAQSRNDGPATKNPLSVKGGDTVTYYLTITNVGEETAKNVVVTDQVPDGLSLISGSLSDQGTVADGRLEWRLGDLARGESKTVRFQVTVPTVTQATVWKNIGRMTYDDHPDPPEPSNEVEIEEVPPEPTTTAPTPEPDGGTLHNTSAGIYDTARGSEPSAVPPSKEPENPPSTGTAYPVGLCALLLVSAGAAVLAVKKSKAQK